MLLAEELAVITVLLAEEMAVITVLLLGRAWLRTALNEQSLQAFLKRLRNHLPIARSVEEVLLLLWKKHVFCVRTGHHSAGREVAVRQDVDMTYRVLNNTGYSTFLPQVSQ